MTLLLIDDHEILLQGYISILKDKKYNFYKARNCMEVYEHLQEGLIPDVAFMDHSLPPFPEQNLFSGVDCALLIKSYAPLCNILVITAHEEALTLYDIYQKTHPEGLILKSDFTSEMIESLVSGDTPFPFLSNRAKEAIQEVQIKETLLSSTNIEILMYLSNGFKINELEGIVCLSTSAIQKRITKMLREFKVKDYQELIRLLKKDQIL